MPLASSSTMLRDQILVLLAPVLAALGLRIDDHVGEEIVVAARLLEIVRAAPWRAPRRPAACEHLDAHALADQRGGEMVRRAAHEAAVLRGPGLQRLAPLHHLGVVARHLPGAVDAPVRAFRLERHQLDVFRRAPGSRRARRPNCTELRNAGCSVTSVDELAVDIDRAAVLQRLDVFRAGLAGRHGRLPVLSRPARRCP